MKKDKILLIDGLSILNRAFYGVRPMESSNGTPTNAIHGFLNMLFKIMEEEKPTHMGVAFDLPVPTFRHEMFEEYKGTRKPAPDNLKIQTGLIKEILQKMNISVLTNPGYEADDIIGTIAGMAENDNMEVSIFSGDKDLLQLATDNVKICMPRSKAGKTETFYYYADDVKNEFGVNPQEFIDVKALMGDTSDNIPGVAGIGEKTATKLISEYGSIENIYDHIDEIKPTGVKTKLEKGIEDAKMSKTLATINTKVDLEWNSDNCKIGELKNEESTEALKELELQFVLARLEVLKI